jgi:2-oxoglutarate dehydrogenase E2 component (dihydrolipoamide succinyltransferase)
MNMAIEVTVPSVGESITEVVVAHWLKDVGEAVSADEALVELETEKATVTVPAPQSGVLSERRAAEGDTIKVGAVIATLAPGDGARPVAKPTATAPAPAAAPAPAPKTVTVPVTESGPVPVAVAAPAPAPARPRTPTPAGPDEDVVPMSNIRRRIAERLVEAQKSAAILTTFNECDMSAVTALRERYQESFTKKHGMKLGFMSFFVKACIEALKEFRGVNAEVRGDSIVYKKRYHVGVAVGGGKGLVVPVLRDADRLSFADIEKTIADFGARARESRLSPDELSGGTFTISNGGIYGSMMSTPLLNHPQTGILGMHKIMKRPVAVGDAVALRPMMYLALSYDHRVIDGREAVQFLVRVKDCIESPERLLLEV